MVVLIILDGFGVSTDPESTFWASKRGNFERLEQFFPFTTLQASGIAVGLKWGEEGNSEVGHLILGSGKTIYHHLPRISLSIQDGSFFENGSFKKAASHAKRNQSALHLVGLFSSGSVHAYPDHLYALLEFAKKEGLGKVYLHLFTDGRDAEPLEAKNFLQSLEERIEKLYPFASIRSLIGRDYAMDRDGDWEKIEKTYNLLVRGEGNKFQSVLEYLGEEYHKGLTDEFIEPGWDGNQESRIKNRDAVIFFNFREDSARELAQAFVEEGFDKFPREKITDAAFVTMTEYEKKYSALAAFGPLDASQPLAKILSENNLKQFHIAETDKYAHVTYFFNGGKEVAFPGEERRIIPSLGAAHVDEQPQMRAREVLDEILMALAAKHADFIVANFANADMVGHTGNFAACVEAVEVLDSVLGQLIPRAVAGEMTLLVTGDHGNVETKIDLHTGRPLTEHTTNPVPFYAVGPALPERLRGASRLTQDPIGTLADIAPTVLQILKLKVPVSMTGKSLLH